MSNILISKFCATKKANPEPIAIEGAEVQAALTSLRKAHNEFERQKKNVDVTLIKSNNNPITKGCKMEDVLKDFIKKGSAMDRDIQDIERSYLVTQKMTADDVNRGKKISANLYILIKDIGFDISPGATSMITNKIDCSKNQIEIPIRVYNLTYMSDVLVSYLAAFPFSLRQIRLAFPHRLLNCRTYFEFTPSQDITKKITALNQLIKSTEEDE